MSSLTPSELRAFRRAHKLSQRQLAVKLGCSRRAVEEWEAGRREPMALVRLALERLTLDSGLGEG